MAEAKRRISYPEFLTWMSFRHKRGSLHLGMRVERGFALLATLYANSHRDPKKTPPFELHQFAPHADEPVADVDYAEKHWK